MNLEHSSTNSCWRRGTIVHEIMHKLGFLHEHQRDDRDNYVIVNYTMIPNELVSQYQKASDLKMKLKQPGHYDYGSIMHYPQYISGEHTLH